MEKARAVYTNLRWQPGLEDVKAIVQNDQDQPTKELELRSLYWKIFLLFQSTDHTDWQRITTSTRSAYDSLRTHFGSAEASSLTSTVSNPLSEDMESHWSKLRLDDSLRQEIKQDVDRCMPEIDYFRLPRTKQKLENILFIFCKLNPDLSYRQGMHELLAPILYVVDHNALEVDPPSLLEEDAAISSVFDVAYIEHDAFTLFSQVMQNAKKFYEQTTHTASANPLIDQSKRIVNDLLSSVDPELSVHLQNVGIAPQIFLIRWLRLLLGREFAFADVLAIWDVMFSEDFSLALVDYICVTMLLRIRWELLAADHNEALSLLLHYPALDERLSGYELALDSTHLRQNMTIDHGKVLIEKYTGRAPADYKPPTPSMSRNISNLSKFGSARLALRSDSRDGSANSREPSDLEAMMRSTMKNIYNRGEQLGIGKAVRNAVEDVHRRAQEIKESRTPFKNVARDGDAMTLRIMKMEQRNNQLCKLLEKAVADLWLVQKEISDATEQKRKDAIVGEADLERMSVAIGQVQFVQIYLQDSTLPLPQNEVSDGTASSSNTSQVQSDGVVDLSHIGANEPRSRATVGSAPFVDDASRDAKADDGDQNEQSSTLAQLETLQDESFVESAPDKRPTLAESSYSWMLGQSDPAAELLDGTKSSRKATPIRPDFLFGGGEDSPASSSGSPRRTRRAQKRNAIGVSDTGAALPYDQ